MLKTLSLLPVTLARSIPSGPMDLCMFKCSLTSFSPTKGNFVLIGGFLVSDASDYWGWILSVKTMVRKSLIIFNSRCPVPFHSGPAFSMVLFWYAWTSFCCCSCSLPHSTPDGVWLPWQHPYTLSVCIFLTGHLRDLLNPFSF